MNKEGLRIEGNLDDINPFAKTSTGKPVCKVKINNLTYNWWEITAAKEFAEKDPIGKQVVCIYTEKPNPQSEQFPYKNVNSLGFPEDLPEVKTERELKQEQVKEVPHGFKPAEQSEGTDIGKPNKYIEGQSFGLACKLAMMRLQHEQMFSKDKYKNLVKELFDLNQETIKELREE